jgi:hypothetical protein
VTSGDSQLLSSWGCFFAPDADSWGQSMGYLFKPRIQMFVLVLTRSIFYTGKTLTAHCCKNYNCFLGLTHFPTASRSNQELFTAIVSSRLSLFWILSLRRSLSGFVPNLKFHHTAVSPLVHL